MLNINGIIMKTKILKNIIILSFINVLNNIAFAEDNVEQKNEVINEKIQNHVNKIIIVKDEVNQNVTDYINRSNYKYDHDINYDLKLQNDSLSSFLEDEQVTDEVKNKIIDTTISMKNFINYIETLNIDNFIVVNIPSYQLIAFENFNPVLESKVVVGLKNRKTPLETLNVISLKYNPTWTPTVNMIKKHIKRNGKINIDFLKKHGLKAYKDGEEILYEDLINEENYHYSQPSGIDNALGVIKFETDSKKNIYLHDTNQPNLFNKKERAFSSGCVRVQNYLDLASWLSDSSKEKIEKNINKNKTYYQKVKKTPVFFTYFQTLVNKNNELVIFKNNYNLSSEYIQNMFTIIDLN